jgi:hypothetical protein
VSRFHLVLFVVVAFPKVFLAQNQPPSDPQALAVALQSIAALTAGTSITDVTLTGTVTWNGSGPDTGTGTLRALGTGESRMDLPLTSGTRTEVRDAQTGVAEGQWSGPSNASGTFAFHNCWTDAAWFFPALSSLTAGTNVVLSYIGIETRNGASVQHVQSYVYQAGQFYSPTPQQLSTMDFFLDAGTLLPVALTFNAHPDSDPTINLLNEVDFSNYQTVSRVVMPMRIQRYQQGNLTVDFVVTDAAVNTGLQLSTFAIN